MPYENAFYKYIRDVIPFNDTVVGIDHIDAHMGFNRIAADYIFLDSVVPSPKGNPWLFSRDCISFDETIITGVHQYNAVVMMPNDVIVFNSIVVWTCEDETANLWLQGITDYLVVMRILKKDRESSSFCINIIALNFAVLGLVQTNSTISEFDWVIYYQYIGTVNIHHVWIVGKDITLNFGTISIDS